MRIGKVEPSGRPVIWTSLKLGPNLTGHPSGSTFPTLTMTPWKILFIRPSVILSNLVCLRNTSYILARIWMTLWYIRSTTSLDVYVGRKFMFNKICRSYGPWQLEFLTHFSLFSHLLLYCLMNFLDFNIKVIGSDIHTSVYDKRDDFGFPIVNFPWLSGDVPRLPSYDIYISQLVRFARCCTSVLDFHSKNLQITSKLLTQGYRYHKLRKTFGKFFRSYSEILSKFGDISFQKYLSKVISHPVFYGDLVNKLRRVKDTPNFILSGSKIVKRLRRRQYDPVIIERTIGLVLGLSTALYEPFLKHCTLTNKAVGTIWRALSKPPQRRQGPDLCPLWLLVGTPSAIRPELAFSRAEHSRPYSDVAKYFLIYNIY